MSPPNHATPLKVRTVYFSQNFLFDGSDGLGGEAMAGRIVIGLTGIVEEPTKKYVHHFTLKGRKGESSEMLCGNYSCFVSAASLLGGANGGVCLLAFLRLHGRIWG